MSVLGSTYQEVRRIPVADLATDWDPTAGELPPADEWISVGGPQALGTIRVVGVYVDAAGEQVAGGDWSFVPVEPARVDGIGSLSGIDNALALYGDAVATLAGGEVYLLDAMSAYAITLCTTAGTAPGGAAELVILARKV